MASSSHNPDHHQGNFPVPFPKPPSPDPLIFPVDHFAAELNDVAPPPTDPPPPYPSGARYSRRARASTTRSTRRAAHLSEDSHVSSMLPDSGGESETSPLLGGRRRRSTSHSSTVHSAQSFAHTIINSSRNVMSLFRVDTDPSISMVGPDTGLPFLARAKRYFRPLIQKQYYAALLHLLFINFPFELVAWVSLFVGTLTGTTLLITLPIGVIICFFDLLGARILARSEIALQTRFHGPLAMSPPSPPHPIFSRMRPSTSSESSSRLEHGRSSPEATPETSFLRLSFLMFRDPTSYQALFYFLVIKPGLTLIITLSLLILVPPALILVVPAPAVLRAVRRVGIWQAEVAIDALS